MKVTIRDSNAVASLQPLDVAAYLRANGWTMDRGTPGKEAFWTKPSPEEDPFEIQLPLDTSFRDFVLRMHEVLQTLEIAEQRSQLEIFRDLHMTSADVIRIRVLAKESADGTVSLEQGVELVEHARDLIMAGACVTASPRHWYRRKRPIRAEEYLRTVRLGQTEIGSYVITVLSRVAPELKGSLNLLDPFERRVTTRLAQLLELTNTAAEESIATGSVDNFKEAIDQGVSVNLCDAIAGLARDTQSNDGIKIEFTWSPARPQRTRTLASVRLVPAAVEVIAEAGRVLRTIEPWEDVTLVGTVVRLESERDGDNDVATIRGRFDDHVRNVRVSVSPNDRQSVIEAFRDRSRVRCKGDVMSAGKMLVMTEHAGITIDHRKVK